MPRVPTAARKLGGLVCAGPEPLLDRTKEVPMCDKFSTQRRDFGADSLQMPDERLATQFVIAVRGN